MFLFHCQKSFECCQRSQELKIFRNFLGASKDRTKSPASVHYCGEIVYVTRNMEIYSKSPQKLCKHIPGMSVQGHSVCQLTPIDNLYLDK